MTMTLIGMRVSVSLFVCVCVCVLVEEREKHSRGEQRARMRCRCSFLFFFQVGTLNIAIVHCEFEHGENITVDSTLCHRWSLAFEQLQWQLWQSSIIMFLFLGDGRNYTVKPSSLTRSRHNTFRKIVFAFGPLN